MRRSSLEGRTKTEDFIKQAAGKFKDKGGKEYGVEAVELSSLLLVSEYASFSSKLKDEERKKLVDGGIAKLKNDQGAAAIKRLRLSIDSEDSAALGKDDPPERLSAFKTWIDRAHALGCDQVGLSVDYVGTDEQQRDAAVLGIQRLCEYIKEKGYNIKVLAETRRDLSTDCKWLNDVIEKALKALNAWKDDDKVHEMGYAYPCGALLNLARIVDQDPVGAINDLAKTLAGLVVEFNTFDVLAPTLRDRDNDYNSYLAIDKRPEHWHWPRPGEYLTVRYTGNDESTGIVNSLSVVHSIKGLV
jgi:hypothetical protein